MSDILIKPSTLEELKEIQAKILFSRTDRVTKISDGSVINGLLYANAKTGQKAMKDIALAQSHFFPDSTYGIYLDEIANLFGVAPRFGSMPSTTYIRVHGTAGTIYVAGLIVTGSHGIRFETEETKTITSIGFTYIKAVSQVSGLKSNVKDLTLDTMLSPPAGHEYVINDYIASNGRDEEDDDTFRERIKNSKNLFSKGTISSLEQLLMDAYDGKLLRLFNYGTDGNGKIVLGALAQNGEDFSNIDFNTMLEACTDFLSLPEMCPNGLNYIGITFRNIEWHPIDISCRLRLSTGYVASEVRTQIQVRLNKYIDYRFWKVGDRIEWDNLLQIVKTTEGVEYVLDDFFTPNSDITVDYSKLPRIRGFELRDLSGTILDSFSGTLNPVYFPNSLDFNYISSILTNL